MDTFSKSFNAIILSVTLTVVSLCATLALKIPVLAQNPAGGAPQGPIDIQADEQEFAGDQVIAKGKVRVSYKDSVVSAPMATLMRDAGGNPQRAVFTGHPHLTQGDNKIDAETLTFEIVNSRIVAEGKAHSEVISGGAEPAADKTATAAAQNISGDTKPAPERIVTDADRQEYDRASGKFEATGHVRVIHGNINVHADKLQLVYGLDNKPETAVFTGNVAATQDRNTTTADAITYSLATKRLQATGHVKSKVIQEKKDDKKKAAVDGGGLPPATAAESSSGAAEETITIVSDTQDYSKSTGRISAAGNVKIFYQDTVGVGPNVVLVSNSEGKADRVIFTGRSQISQTGKRWIADRIEMTIADKKVLAQGNTKALILQTPRQGQPTAPAEGARMAGRPAPANTISATKVDSTR